MSSNKSDAEQVGGPFMIQDRDHAPETGQVGHEPPHGRGKEEQSQAYSGDRDGGDPEPRPQNGGERRRKQRFL